MFDAWHRRPDRAAVLLDFDGTLAEIVDRPEDARPLPGAVEVLRVLAGRYALVAVVSGRRVSFLREHVGVPGVVLSGMYGLESWRDGQYAVHPDASRWQPAVAAVADRAEAELSRGVGIERKGLSVTLHVREHPEHEPAVRAWAGRVAAQTGLALHEARRSYEFRPPLAADKGTAVRALVAAVDAACYVGDDVGDLPAFAALDELAARGMIVVKVVAASDETPPELEAAADVVVDGPSGALALLRSLGGA